MVTILKKLHLYGLYSRVCIFLINKVFISDKSFSRAFRRKALCSLGHKIGEGTVIVSPVNIIGKVEIGDNCWINRGFTVHGNGTVKIGNSCDIAPDVTFLTGGHKIGTSQRRAGEGESYVISVGDGCWIGARSTIMRNTCIGHGCVIAACSCVIGDIESDTLVGGVPAKEIRRLSDSEA